MPATKKRVSSKGLTLQEAMRSICPKEYEEYEPLSREVEVVEEAGWLKNGLLRTAGIGDYPGIREKGRLIVVFADKWQAGDVLATGRDSRTLARRSIPSDIVPTLALDITGSRALGDGFSLDSLRFRVPRKVTCKLTELATRNWVREKVEAGFVPKDKCDLERLAKRELGAKFGKRAFLRAWREHAPQAWKQGGRKPQPSKSRTVNPRRDRNVKEPGKAPTAHQKPTS